MVVIPSALALGGTSASYNVPSYEPSIATDNTTSATYALTVHSVAYNEHYADSAHYCGWVGIFGGLCVEVAVINFTAPTNGSTLPYSVGIGITLNDNIDTWTNCNYTILWDGDNSGHGDEIFPMHEYDTVPVTCGNKSAYNINLDFDGNYTFEYCGTNPGGVVSCGNDTFHIDRSEVSESKMWGGMFFPAIMLTASVFLSWFGYKRREDHPTLYWLYSYASVILIPLSITAIFYLLQEYIKAPAILDTYSSLLTVLCWGILFVTFGYGLIMVTKFVIKKLIESSNRRKGKVEI